MGRVQLGELAAFAAVAEYASFTKGAARMGVALPTISQTVRQLEERLGVRLFNRTTRSVSLTEAGRRLLLEVQPILDNLNAALENVNRFRQTPMGPLRIAIDRTAHAVLRARMLNPLIQPFLAAYPDIQLEISISDVQLDIVDGRFDAGIRSGHRIERDMTMVRLMDEFRLLAVAAPAYLAARAPIVHPMDLQTCNCIRYRMPHDGSLHPWVFKAKEETIDVAVGGALVVNDLEFAVTAVLGGVGVAYLPEPLVAAHLAQGRLLAVVPGWSLTMPGIFLYHPSRRQVPVALEVFIRAAESWRRGATFAMVRGVEPGAGVSLPKGPAGAGGQRSGAAAASA
jgi:DNA-binding transcriptional LysR family regulator